MLGAVVRQYRQYGQYYTVTLLHYDTMAVRQYDSTTVRNMTVWVWHIAYSLQVTGSPVTDFKQPLFLVGFKTAICAFSHLRMCVLA